MSWRAGTLVGSLLILLNSLSAGISAAEFQPDPRCIQTFEGGYRYPQEGWTVLHIEGKPYERGIQHGRLMAPEIAGYIRCLAASYGYKAPAESWRLIRQLTGALMLRHYPQELLDEMQGIADGASAAGALVDGRPLDVTDIAAINAANELDLLEDALKATPTGVDAVIAAKKGQQGTGSKPAKREHPTRCSAFVANGPATQDGKIVFGHITMYDLYPANFYNVWVDVSPSEGFHFVMQSTPGGVHSGMDFVINDAGMLMSETTIQQTAFDPAGIPLSVRIRQASQYGDSIEKVADILSQGGNGLCSTEWILADLNKNEIALLNLGLKKSKLLRSSNKEWIGGAEHFYWSCNNAKDLDVRLEGSLGLRGRPSAAAVFEPTKRDALWLTLYAENKGRIDEGFARKVLTTPALVSAFSVDAVYTTSDLARKFSMRASFGPPVGSVRNPSPLERGRFPEIRPLVSNAWTLVDCARPRAGRNPASEHRESPPLDLHNPANPSGKELSVSPKKEGEIETQPAWRGTLLPESDADAWLPVAFANFEKIVALENALLRKSPSRELGPEQWEEIGVEVSYYRSVYELGVKAGEDKALGAIRQEVGDENWYRIASGKGTLLLHSLRALLGSAHFDRLMNEFGATYSGKRVGTDSFRVFLEKGTGKDLRGFFSGWTAEKGLPNVRLQRAEYKRNNKGWTTVVGVERDKSGGPVVVPVSVETDGEEEKTLSFVLSNSTQTVEITTEEKPVRVVVNKYGIASFGSRRAPFTVLSFDTELEQTLIVAGTAGDVLANAEAARLLQQALRRREHNITVPIRLESEVSEEELRTHHVVLIGRPNSNGLTRRWEKELPARFGSQSFIVGDETFAHPESSVVCAALNPLNSRYSIVCVAGMGGLGTLRAVPAFEEESLPYAQVVVLPHNREIQALTIPDPELVKSLRHP